MQTSPRILLSVPHMGGLEQKYVDEAFATNWLSTVGPNLNAFEQEFEEQFGVHAVAVSSGTAAIHMGLRALGVESGDTVFCSDLTFVATVNPIRYLGAAPVFIDSDRATWNMDPALLAMALKIAGDRNRLPKAVVVVHLFGQCADMTPILEACRQYDVPVLEDAAEALGGSYKGQPAGTVSDCGIFSFNGNKIITTTGGGMFVSKRREVADQVRFWATQACDAGAAHEHSQLGYNYRMSNVLAGIGRGQLQVLAERVRQRREIAMRYDAAFLNLRGLSLMPQARYGVHTNWLSCFLIDEHAFGCSRDELIRNLDLAGIEARPVWKPMHLQPLYRDVRSYGGAVGEDLFRRGICLPSSSSLSEQDQSRVITAIAQAHATTAAAFTRDLQVLSEAIGETQPVESALLK
jgi:pyridoxal phosphate-dependent aminotransferase EpsN